MTGPRADGRELPIRGLRVRWDAVAPDSYLRRIPAIAGLDALTFHAPVTCFVGENGSGKSTLLEAIAVAARFNPEGGTRNYRFSTRDSHSPLGGALTLVRGPRRPEWGYFLRAESFYNVATAEEDYSQGPGGRPQRYHERSHGESFLALARDSFRPGGLYLLDEPEAALSPQRQLTLLIGIHRCACRGAQFVMASHSPILLGLPEAELLSFDGGEIRPVAWEDTDSCRITRLFLEDRARLLNRRLEEE